MYITIVNKYKPENIGHSSGQNGRNRHVCIAGGTKRFKASCSVYPYVAKGGLTWGSSGYEDGMCAMGARLAILSQGL